MLASLSTLMYGAQYINDGFSDRVPSKLSAMRMLVDMRLKGRDHAVVA